jgi:hypothetical protein
MNLGQIGWGGVNWTGLAQDKDKTRALVNAVMNLRVPQNTAKVLSSFIIGTLSSSAQLHRVS